jgi:metal transporter CNNM
MDATHSIQRRTGLAPQTAPSCLVKLLVIGAYLPLLGAWPTRSRHVSIFTDELPVPADEPTLWIYLVVAIGLVLLGGAFAGLTIALMGQVRVFQVPYATLKLTCVG